MAWRRPAIDASFTRPFPELEPSGYLRATPILVDGALYASNAVGLVEAFDPGTGETVWLQRPRLPTLEGVAGRGVHDVAFWSDGTADRRIFSFRNRFLYALDAATGEPITGFGADGRVDLTPEGANSARGGASPIVVGDVIVVAGVVDGAGDSGVRWRNSAPENVRGYDARTGELRWTFHVVPRPGEFGADTWGGGSLELSGDLGSWCCLSADEDLGTVHVPLTAPTAAYYGGHRPGDNLFSNSLVALNAATGERIWHFQMVHHDLWEYDTVRPPTLGEITVDGHRIGAVMQPSKTGFLYVFDRATGEPVWPIEERPVPPSTVPGERASPTQPFPTKPPPFAHQGVSEEDLIDFTAALEEEARNVASRFVLGPLFTPPTLASHEPGGTDGTLALPGLQQVVVEVRCLKHPAYRHRAQIRQRGGAGSPSRRELVHGLIVEMYITPLAHPASGCLDIARASGQRGAETLGFGDFAAPPRGTRRMAGTTGGQVATVGEHVRELRAWFGGLRLVFAVCAGLLLAVAAIPAAQSPDQEWRYFGGDEAFTRYSPLDQIDRENVGELEIAWRRPAADPELQAVFPDLGVNAYLKSTPILIDGVLYAPNAHGLMEAFDPATGETVWRQPPFAATEEEAAGSSTRGAAHWTDGTASRLLLVRGGYLYALDARTGRRVPAFGLADQGRVDLDWEHALAGEFNWTSGPIIVGDVVVVAGTTGGSGDGGIVREAAPEDVRGFDVRTGELLWTFHVVPRPGEFGADTWGDGSGDYSGDLGSWCCLTADTERGHVYVPLSAPTGMVYGGHRPGDNLFSDSLVALDAATGERVWHFQMVHHDIWEYDTVGPAILGDITVDGRRIEAVMQPSKTAFLYVFDREAGEPVWPIEERPVPQSTVPGERTSPTQPFPTKPPPFDRQGVTVDDLIDFTPELRAAALEAVESLVLGPLFTPPWPRGGDPGGKLGTLTVPGGWGAGNWHTGAFDPETGIYYAVSHTMPTVWSVSPTTAEDATLAWATSRGEELRVPTPRPHGLPITKPPYGRITALDLNRGELAWMVPNGDGPRNHPLLRDLDLPPLGIPNRPAPLVTGSLLFLGEGSDAIIGTQRGEGDPSDPEQDQSWRWGRKFRAYDKATGDVIWETELPAGTTGGPMTYLHEGRQYIVVAVGARDEIPEWVALALP